ncbi:MAG: metallophosphoesterase [Verrucomicrobiota bacterium]
MKQLSNLAMTDVASKKPTGRVFLAVLMALIVLCAGVALRNYAFVRAGMLRPDFDLIHQAYNFNLTLLPIILLIISAVFLGLALLAGLWRKTFFWVAIFYSLIALNLFLLRIYVTDIEPKRLDVHQIRLETPKLSEAVRLVHISDIQAGSIGDYEISIFEKIAELEPDLIIYTGDFLQAVPPATFDGEFPKLLELFRSVTPRYGIFAVFGDTERELYSFKPDALEPVQMLSSRSKEFAAGGGQLSVMGLSLYQSKNPEWSTRSVGDWLGRTEEATFRILMGHAPDYALGIEELAIDLCLAGHTHGGQVRLPFLGPLVIDSKVPKDWSRGFRRIGIPYLNVSAGAGSNRFQGLPPIRFNCPTEMTVIDLVPIRGMR